MTEKTAIVSAVSELVNKPVPIEITPIESEYYGMNHIIFLLDEDEEYGKWYSEDQKALGFQFNVGQLKDTFVYILRDSIKINETGVSFEHKVIRNPHNVPDYVFETHEFYELLSKAMNDVIAEFLEWKKTQDDT